MIERVRSGPAEPAVSLEPAPPCRILHLEDNLMDRELVAAHLERGGVVASIEQMDTRRAFLDALGRGAFDVILADHSLPAFDGLTALELARTLAPEKPFVFVSGVLDEATAANALREGAADYVGKQQLDRLPSAIRRALAEAPARLEPGRAGGGPSLPDRYLELEARVARRTAALAESEARFAIYFEAADEWLFDIDLGPSGQAVLRACNPAALRALGLAAAAVRGRSLQDVLGHEAARQITDPLERGADDSVVRVELDLPTVAGRRSFEMALVRLRGQDDVAGQVVHVLGTARDVTERRELESRLLQSQKMEALGQLAGGVAHDMNNVLQAVLGLAGLIARHADDQGTVRKLATTMLEATERGTSVVQRLLAFARHSDLRAEEVDAVGLLNDLREMLAHTLGTGITVTAKVPLMLPSVLVDRGQLETVLVNLATNARDAMPEGGTLVLAATVETVAMGQPHVAVLAPGGYVRITAVDNGIGMSAATVARAAEPFFTTKTRGRGTGLGLAMAKGFAEQSGGALRVESSLGQGTTVTLWFPQAQPASSPERAPSAAGVSTLEATTPARLGRILVVDDEPLVRSVLVTTLKAHGHAVIEAEDGLAALARLAGEPIDLLVTDFSMPGLDGLALIRAARERRPALAAVLVTGHLSETNTGSLSEAHRDGRFSLLHKPVAAKRLVQTADALLAADDDLLQQVSRADRLPA